MSEGPISFGKPLFFLIAIGCAGGGYYAFTHWPVSVDTGKGWSVSLPHGWTWVPANDPTNDSKIHCSGPLGEEHQGAAWAMMFYHGTLMWPEMVVKNLPIPPDKQSDDELDHKKTLFYEYEDLQGMRWMGCAIERGDALIYYAIGCPKAVFELHRPTLEKSVKGTRCQR